MLDIGTKVKYSKVWLDSTQIKRTKWRGTIAAHYNGEGVSDTSFVYVRWEGDTEDRLINVHNLTIIKDKEAAVKKPTPKPEVAIPDLKTLTISGIAKLIIKDWKIVNYAAKPYLMAMNELKTINDKVGFDNGASIVRYFLSNASSYRGDVARAVKIELRKRLEIGA
jgi:hypothetical protein